ncbi:MAG TPA: hypothetical protein PKM78_01805 [Anaerolineae bacterium]|nr:hypothetical protein [Anaerolineae bacterium]HNU02610.1 hypothetical protein [Anaerolineae bacterium]
MITQAAKELFALVNALCGGLLFLGLLIYLVRARPRRAAIVVSLLLLILVCIANAFIVYFWL